MFGQLRILYKSNRLKLRKMLNIYTEVVNIKVVDINTQHKYLFIKEY